MKFKVLFGMLTVVLLTVLGMPSCLSDMDEEGEKTIGHKEYELTVASVKLPGVLTSSGSNLLAEVFAVKRDASSEWEAMGSISEFEYEEGTNTVSTSARPVTSMKGWAIRHGPSIS